MREALGTAILVGLLAVSVALPTAAHADSIVDTWTLEGFTGSVVVSPDGSTVYVASNVGSDDRIYVVDAADGSEIARYMGPSWTNFAFGLALSLDGSLLYAASEDTHELFVFDTVTGAIVETVTTAISPVDVEVASDGSVLVVSRYGARVDVFFGNPLSLVHSIPVTGAELFSIAVSPDSATAYVANSGGSVSVIDVATGTETAVVPVAGVPRGIALSPDGTQLAIATFSGNELVTLDTDTLTITTTTVVSAYAPAYTIDGSLIYVARLTGALVEVFTPSDLVLRETIGPFSGSLRQIAMSPVGDRVYVSSNNGSIGVIQREVAPVFTTAAGALADAQVGTAYDAVVHATGLPAPVYSVTAGALPNGLTLDGASGAIAGTPTTVGDYSFEVTATSGPNAVTRDFTIAVAAAAVAPPELADTGVDMSALTSLAALMLALGIGGLVALRSSVAGRPARRAAD